MFFASFRLGRRTGLDDAQTAALAFRAPPGPPRADVPSALQGGKEVTMASQSKQPATNERILRLLEEVKAQLAETAKRQEQMARELNRLSRR
jgi:hypothetical protein